MRRVLALVILAMIVILAVRCAAGNTEKTKEPAVQKKTEATQNSGKQKRKDVEITISAVGDCTLGKDPSSAYATSFNAAYDKNGADWFLQNVRSVFEEDDMTIANFEGTLTDSNSAADKTFTFKGDDDYLKVLTGSGVDFMSFANNHAYDYGETGYKDTIQVFEENNVPYASYDKVGTYKVKGVKIGVVSVYGENAFTDIKNGIQELKDRDMDIIIVSMHSGAERVYYPAERQIQLGHLAVDEGADLVIGHHPHVLEGVEFYKGVYINYSIGNFCFGGNSHPTDLNTVILQKTFKLKNGKLHRDDQLHIIPCSISSASSYNNYQPSILSGDQKQSILTKMNQYSASLGVSFDSNGNAEPDQEESGSTKNEGTEGLTNKDTKSTGKQKSSSTGESSTHTGKQESANTGKQK